MTINATAIWRVRPSGSNTNGGGYDPGISGAATDYSQQNSAQASGTAGTCSATTTWVDSTANAFTSAMVGNAMYITGAGYTTGFYFVTAYTSASTVTLDRSPGTGTTGTWHLGGGWASFVNTSSTYIVAGNTIYILGSGISSPSSSNFDYNISSATTSQAGSATAGYVRFIGDPATSGGVGLPVIKLSVTTAFGNANYVWYQNIFFVCAGTGAMINNTGTPTVAIGIVFYQNGNNAGMLNAARAVIGCEFYNSSAGTNTVYCIATGAMCIFINNNFHDTIGPAINANSNGFAIAVNNIFSNIGGSSSTEAVYLDRNSTSSGHLITQNTFDSVIGTPITVGTASDLESCIIADNIFSNCQTTGTYGVNYAGSTISAGNTANCPFFNWNYYYNNLTNLNNLTNGANDITGGGNPYIQQSTENYSPVNTIYNNGMWGSAFPQHLSGKTNTVQTYSTTGGVQPQTAGKTTTVIANNVINLYSDHEGDT